MIRTWNPENAIVIVSWSSSLTNLTNSKEIKNWNSLTFNYTEDRYDFTTATTGQITRSKIVNKLGTCSIVSPEGSDVSEVLSNLVNSDTKITVSLVEKTPKGDTPVTVVEYTLSEGSISDPGDATRQKTAGDRTWMITGEITKLEETDYTD